MQTVIECANYTTLTSTGGLVRSGAGGLMGIFVASASATPTITVFDSLTGTGTQIVNVFTPVAGTFYPMPFFFGVGCFVLLSGTVTCTVGVGPVTA